MINEIQIKHYLALNIGESPIQYLHLYSKKSQGVDEIHIRNALGKFYAMDHYTPSATSGQTGHYSITLTMKRDLIQ